jgi:hypothetical protein
VATIAAGEERAVDIGEVNNVIFVNNSSIGLYPYLVLERERRRRRKRLSKWIAMVLAMPRVLRNLPLFRLTILVEGHVEPCRGPCVLVGSNEDRITVPGFGTRDGQSRRRWKSQLCARRSTIRFGQELCACSLRRLDRLIILRAQHNVILPEPSSL